MKTLIVIFLMICTIVQGQCFEKTYTKRTIPKSIRVISTMVAWSILNGIGDGLNDNGNKTMGHACNAASAAALLGGTIWSHPEKGEWPIYFTDAIFLRYVFFDASYNATRGLPYNYIGTTAGTDRMLSKVPAGFRTFTKGISLGLSIGITIDQLEPQRKHYWNKNRNFKNR